MTETTAKIPKVLTLEDMRRKLQAYQAQNDPAQPVRYLFRGERRDWGAIIPSVAHPNLGRNSDGFQQLARLWQAARRVTQHMSGNRPPDELNAVALLPHYYGIPSPLIDLTGTWQVAEYFAHFGHVPGEVAHVYVVDCDKIRARKDLILIDLDFLAFPASLGGLRTRWLRQDGFAVTTSDWADPQAAKSFNLRDPRYSDAFRDTIAFEFASPATSTLDLKDVLRLRPRSRPTAAA